MHDSSTKIVRECSREDHQHSKVEKSSLEWEICYNSKSQSLGRPYHSAECQHTAGKSLEREGIWQFLLLETTKSGKENIRNWELDVWRDRWCDRSYEDFIVTVTAKILQKDKTYWITSRAFGNTCIKNRETIPLFESINNFPRDAVLKDGDVMCVILIEFSMRHIMPNHQENASLSAFRHEYPARSNVIYNGDLQSGKIQDTCPFDVKLFSKDGTEFKCHKIVLAAKSPSFVRSLCSKPTIVDGCIIKKMKDLTKETLELVLHYIYSGQIKSSWKDLKVITEFANAAESFEFAYVLKFLDYNLGVVCTKSMVVPLLEFAERNKLWIATRQLLEYIACSSKQWGCYQKCYGSRAWILYNQEERKQLKCLLHHKHLIDETIHDFLEISEEKQETNLNNGERFSTMFPVLFGEDNKKISNLLSYLEEVVLSFTIKHDNIDQEMEISAAIFDRLEISPVRDNVKQFFAYLIKVYKNLRDSTDKSVRENIFAFMTVFPINETRVVFVFNTPSGQAKSCGYALHGAKVKTTKSVLDFLNKELQKIDESCDEGPPLKFSLDKLEEIKKHCNLSGWISQGVLLFNSRLTYQGEIWDHFTNQLLKCIGNSKNCIVFILCGLHALSKSTLLNPIIKQKDHLILQVYHPTAENQPLPEYTWDAVCPFGDDSRLKKYQSYFNMKESQKEATSDDRTSDEDPPEEPEHKSSRRKMRESVKHPGCKKSKN